MIETTGKLKELLEETSGDLTHDSTNDWINRIDSMEEDEIEDLIEDMRWFDTLAIDRLEKLYNKKTSQIESDPPLQGFRSLGTQPPGELESLFEACETEQNVHTMMSGYSEVQSVISSRRSWSWEE